MKTKTLQKSFGLIILLCSIALLVVTCKKDPCKKVTCQNGGTAVAADKECSCDCPFEYEGEFCETKKEFVKCKINGVDYQSDLVIVDIITDNSITYKKIETTNAANTDWINLYIRSALSVGTYQATMSAEDFYCIYNDLSFEDPSTSGSLSLTNVTDRYEGTFDFVTYYDSVMVTEGSFSVKK